MMDMLTVELVAAYASLYVHCWSQYAVQQRHGSYWRVPEPLTLPLLAAHLHGRWTLGTYLLDAQGRCRLAVFDDDRQDGLARLGALARELAQAGVPTVLEASRRGGHLWVHLLEPTPARLVRAWLLPAALALGVEFYPKQDRPGPDGAGSLIRLPLGLHQRTRCWYPLVQMTDDGSFVPVGQTVAQCCAWLCEHVQRVAVPALVQGMDASPALGVEGNAAPMASHETLGRPGGGAIRAWCRSQDILAVIGRFVALDGRGVGSCPFKEHHHRGDRRPSFQVFGGDDPHWYCYTWGRAGDLFDFICLYYHLSPHEAWQRLQDGTLC